MEEQRIFGFEPIIFDDSKVLILGTLPGKKSLEEKMYYADKGNYFWKFLAFYMNSPFPNNSASKIQLLKKSKIAVWDVYESGIRINKKTKKKTSNDSDITKIIPNDIAYFLSEHPKIERVGAAGKEAYNYLKSINLECEVVRLPSTSGSNGGQWGNKNIKESIDITRKGWQEWVHFIER